MRRNDAITYTHKLTANHRVSRAEVAQPVTITERVGDCRL